MGKVSSLFSFGIKFYTALFVGVYLGGWVSNAIYNTHFDLQQLVELYKWILAHYGVDSMINSPLGKLPGGDRESGQ